MIFAFDRDGTLKSFGGPVPFSVLAALKEAGHRLSTAGSAPGREQEQQWAANNVLPDFVLSKSELRMLLVLKEPIIWVDDDKSQRSVAEANNMLFLSPQEFMARRHIWLSWEKGIL